MKSNFQLNKIIKKYLRLINIKISNNLIEKLLQNHPNPNSLANIQDVFNELGIENIALEFTESEKEKLFELPTPFISNNIGGDFIVVKNVTNNFIEYYNALTGEVKEEWSVFKNQYTGIVLLAFPESYNKKKLSLSISNISKIFQIFIILLLVAFYVYTFYEKTLSWMVSVLFITKLIGLTVSCLLLENEYSKDISIVNRLCSVKTNDCNKILSSQDSKLFNFVSWSELGFLYFLGGIISLILSKDKIFVSVLSSLLLFNIPTLLFSFYSIWYQYFTAKTWCRFCLITIGLFWVEAILLCNTPSVFSFKASIEWILIMILSFSLPIITLLFIKPILEKVEAFYKTKKELNQLKFNNEIIDGLFKKQKVKEVTDDFALRINGDTESTNAITIITNPTCPPCAETHKKLEQYLNGCYVDLVVNLIFAVDAENYRDYEMSKVAKRIIQIYESKGAKEALEAMNMWYQKKDFENWNKSFPADDLNVEGILKKQNDWCKTNNIYYTPTVLFNNRELPSEYGIEDIKYLMT